MDNYGLGGWDCVAELQKLSIYTSRPERTFHEDVEEAREKCLQRLAKDAGDTFADLEMMQSYQTHPKFQELIDLFMDRKRHGAHGADHAAIGRAAEAWIQAEIDNWAEGYAEVMA